MLSFLKNKPPEIVTINKEARPNLDVLSVTTKDLTETDSKSSIKFSYEINNEGIVEFEIKSNEHNKTTIKISVDSIDYEDTDNINYTLLTNRDEVKAKQNAKGLRVASQEEVVRFLRILNAIAEHYDLNLKRSPEEIYNEKLVKQLRPLVGDLKCCPGVAISLYLSFGKFRIANTKETFSLLGNGEINLREAQPELDFFNTSLLVSSCNN